MTENGARQGVIVCGIDGSSGSRRALQEAIRTAMRRGDRVRAVAVYDPPEVWAAWSYGASAGIPLPDPDALREEEYTAARQMVDEVLAETAWDGTPPEVSVEALPGRPAEVLVDISREADELVVGHRGRGAFGSVVLGSVGLGCVLHATCPVTVVPEPVAA
ncbi:universal stress protein [Actinomycetospora cinnamomea]|uniref:Nucleotide-binding universal stress UspA family protein n=1 Tax=Actinomycetospora cinnamomea TaxID=663609 RepID=A0A2U1F2A4_9PSEU|nr:universal stress protein [Actinomycetospora cinnamomea]PVZ06313.1 nucleotide-binding universal stress UspA family protein [Actinomycetospora cinnamomea]